MLHIYTHGQLTHWTWQILHSTEVQMSNCLLQEKIINMAKTDFDQILRRNDFRIGVGYMVKKLYPDFYSAKITILVLPQF